MGNFYVNYTLAGVTQQAAAAAMAGRTSAVTSMDHGTAVVYDEESDSQDTSIISPLAGDLSKRLHCAVLTHDDDVLWFQPHRDGRLEDEYDSSPGYFDSDAESSDPSGGRRRKAVGSLRIDEG